MRRDLGPLLLLLLALGLLATFAWLTRHPETPILRQAEAWPVVGRLASWIRERYLPTPPLREPADETPAEPGIADLEPPAAPTSPQTGPRVWILAGTVLRRLPSPEATAIYEFPSIASAARLERRGDWFRVHHQGAEGWVFLEGYKEGGGPPYGEVAEPPLPIADQPPDDEKLAAARRYLGDRERTASLGPYTLYTDSRDDELIAHLDALAAGLEAVYVERYGLRPLGIPRAVLVLYRSEMPYRLLQRQVGEIAGLPSTGHSAHGVAAFFAGGRRRGDIAATMVHELVHFLNRRALGPALPPWLDEGLADDLASSRIETDGTLRPFAIGGERRQQGTTLIISGGVATLLELHRELAASPPPLPGLFALDWESFVTSDRSRFHYGASAFWIRYLLQGDGGCHRDAFRQFLAAVAQGRPATAEALRQRLEEDWDALGRSFCAWVAAESARTEPY